ncbi:MAG: c-type cytochrome, partial [Betaproteobacteria bacterium]
MASTRLLLGLALGASLLSITTRAAVPADRAEMVARGEYVAVLGDCSACHTTAGGERLAGGLGIKTPLGTIYSTNITPDRSKGIGRYSFEQFERAMRSGVAADGRNLYPAMPYTSYARVSTEDLRALYAYLMQGIASVDQPNKPAQVTWPASIRWGVSLWNAAFHDDAPFKPDPGRDATWNRGAYLVQGLGHCGACHTPRGLAFQEKASTHDNGMYLAGSTIDDW